MSRTGSVDTIENSVEMILIHDQTWKKCSEVQGNFFTVKNKYFCPAANVRLQVFQGCRRRVSGGIAGGTMASVSEPK